MITLQAQCNQNGRPFDLCQKFDNWTLALEKIWELRKFNMLNSYTVWSDTIAQSGKVRK